MSKREPNPEVQAWCLQKLAEIDSIQQELHDICDRHAKRLHTTVAQNPEQVVRPASIKTKAKPTAVSLKSGLLPAATIPAPSAKQEPKVTRKGGAAATPDPCHLPPIHQTRAQFWQERNRGALKAYKDLTDEEKQTRAKALQDEYDAEMKRLCL